MIAPLAPIQTDPTQGTTRARQDSDVDAKVPQEAFAAPREDQPIAAPTQSSLCEQALQHCDPKFAGKVIVADACVTKSGILRSRPDTIVAQASRQIDQPLDQGGNL